MCNGGNGPNWAGDADWMPTKGRVMDEFFNLCNMALGIPQGLVDNCFLKLVLKQALCCLPGRRQCQEMC